jgi:hypothetical protein
MTDHKAGTREEWLAARLELLAAEKEPTRRSDELARRRQELPWVRRTAAACCSTSSTAPTSERPPLHPASTVAPQALLHALVGSWT